MIRLPEAAPDTLQLEGDFTTDAVAAYHRQSLAWLRAGRLPAVIDLGAVARIDSSPPAGLPEWQSWAGARGVTIEFPSPPVALRTFASLSAASALLGWADDQAAP